MWKQQLCVLLRTENALKTEFYEHDDITRIMRFSWPSFPQTNYFKSLRCSVNGTYDKLNFYPLDRTCHYKPWTPAKDHHSLFHTPGEGGSYKFWFVFGLRHHKSGCSQTRDSSEKSHHPHLKMKEYFRDKRINDHRRSLSNWLTCSGLLKANAVLQRCYKEDDLILALKCENRFIPLS